MRPKRTIPLLALLLVLTACQTSPTERWAVARQSLTTTQDVLSTLHDGGMIEDEQMLQTEPFIKTARAALVKAEALLPDEPGVDEYLDVVAAALAKLEETKRKAIAQ